MYYNQDFEKSHFFENKLHISSLTREIYKILLKKSTAHILTYIEN